MLRVDKLGEIDWEATFGGRGDDWANSVVALASGGIAAAGWTTSDDAGERDFWVLKLDGGGNIVWDHVYGGRKGDSGQSITALADGGRFAALANARLGALRAEADAQAAAQARVDQEQAVWDIVKESTQVAELAQKSRPPAPLDSV